MTRCDGSGHRLHQATTGVGIVVVILGVVLPEGIHAEGGSADQAAEEAHGACAADRFDELTHDGSAYSENCNEELRNVSAASHFCGSQPGHPQDRHPQGWRPQLPHTDSTASLRAFSCSCRCSAVRPSASGIWAAIGFSQLLSSSSCFSIGSTPRPRASTLALVPVPA